MSSIHLAQGLRLLTLYGDATLHDRSMYFDGQRLNALGQVLDQFGQLGVLFEQLKDLCRLLCRKCLALLAGRGESFPMLRIGVGVRFVAIGLSGLREQNEGRRVRGLETERQIKQDEGIDVKLREPHDVETDPDGDDERLGD